MSEIDWLRLQKYIWSRPFWIQLTGPKIWYPPKNGGALQLLFYNFLPSHVVEAAEPPHPHFGPLDPQIRVKSMSRRLKPDQVDYWEGALQCWFYQLCLKMVDHSSHFGTPDPGFRVRSKASRLWPDQVNFWEGTLQLLFINFVWKRLTTTPEVHGAQVLPDPDFGSKN